MLPHPNQISVWPHRRHIVEFGWLDGAAPADVPPHSHAAYQLSLELTGEVEYRLRGGRFTVGPGRLVVIHPGEVHALRDPGPRSPVGAYQLLQLDCSAFADPDASPQPGHGASAGPDAAPRFDLVIDDVGVIEAFGRYVSAVSGQSPQSTCDARLAELLAALQQRCAQPQRAAAARGFDPARMREVKNLLLGNLARTLPLQELARVVGMKPTTLCRQFHRCYGLPPRRFLIAARVELVKRLLREGVPIARAAGLAGFTDQSHLSRHFKRLVQVPPGRYSATGRKNVQDRRRRRG